MIKLKCTCKEAKTTHFKQINKDLDKNGIYKYCPIHSNQHEFWIKNPNSYNVKYEY